MNIKNRLRKLENQSNPDNQQCLCYGRLERLEVWEAEDENEPYLSGEKVPDICEVCYKPVRKQMVVLRDVDSKPSHRENILSK